MSGKLVSRVYEEADLRHPEQTVLVAMADHAHDDGSKVFPSVERIAWKTGYSVRQVHRIIAKLKDMGVLHVVRVGKKGVNTEYRIILSKAPKKMSFSAWKSAQESTDNMTENETDDDNMTGDGTMESTVTGDTDSMTSGCHTNRHTTPIDLTSPDGEVGDGAPAPLSDIAKNIVMAYCEAAGLDHRAIDWAQNMRAAKSLAERGLTPERVQPFYVWLASQRWITGGVTLRLMNSQADAYQEFRRRQLAPVRHIV